MAKARADYTLSFRKLSGEDRDWLALFGDGNADAEAWLSRYRVRTESEDLSGLNRDQSQISSCATGWRRPPSAPWKTEAMSPRWTASSSWCKTPFEEHDGDEAFAAPPPPDHCAIWK